MFDFSCDISVQAFKSLAYNNSGNQTLKNSVINLISTYDKFSYLSWETVEL